MDQDHIEVSQKNFEEPKNNCIWFIQNVLSGTYRQAVGTYGTKSNKFCAVDKIFFSVLKFLKFTSIKYIKI